SAVLGQDRFRVKLYALDLFRLMPQAHYQAVGRSCRDLKLIRQTLAVNDQRMITPRGKAVRQAFEYRSAIMFDSNRFSMNRHRRPHDLAAEILPDRLMSKTNTQDRHPITKTLDHS